MYSKVSGGDYENKIRECLADPEIHTLNLTGIYNFIIIYFT